MAIAHIKEIFREKLEELNKTIDEVQNSANQESKSSMGDKYETGRAMAQNEVFMLQTRHNALKIEIEKLEGLNFSPNTGRIIAGSLVETTMGWFLLSAGLGKVVVEKKPIMCISLHSPLGNELLGKKEGDLYIINSNNYKIMKIL